MYLFGLAGISLETIKTKKNVGFKCQTLMSVAAKHHKITLIGLNEYVWIMIRATHLGGVTL